jgi:hypothetical protein
MLPTKEPSMTRFKIFFLALLMSTGCQVFGEKTCERPLHFTFYRDVDGDGFGNADHHRTIESCYWEEEAPHGYVTRDYRSNTPFDCDDTNARIYPAAPETWYDGINQSCKNLTSDYDSDSDGFDTKEVGGRDCDDENFWINPGRNEVVGDGKDNDCDGEIDEEYLAPLLEE